MFKKPDTMTFITNELDETSAKIRNGETVLGTAAKNKIPLDSSCLEGTCGSCRVIVVFAPPELLPPEDVERETCLERGFSENERLGCQMIACPGLKVKLPNN